MEFGANKTGWSRTRIGPRVFIGSSREAADIARALSSLLGQAGLAPNLWNRGAFEPGETYIEGLERAALECSFAVLVVTPDDVTESRGQTVPSARDNVVFEAGLFMGALGRKRTLLVVQVDAKPKLPTDLLGLSTVLFSRPSRASLLQALDAAALAIEESVRRELLLLDGSGLDADRVAVVGDNGFLGAAARVGSISTSVNGTRRAELFVGSSDGTILHSWEESPGGPIAEWSRFGQDLISGPTSMPLDGRVLVCYVNGSGQVCLRMQASLSGSWGRWFRVGRAYTGPLAITMSKSGPSVLGVRSGKRLMQVARSQDQSWIELRELAKVPRKISVLETILSASSRAEFVLCDERGEIWHSKELESEPDWSEVVHLDGALGVDAAMAVDENGLTVLFVVTQGGELVSCRQRHITGDHWGPWTTVERDLRWSGISVTSVPSGFVIFGNSEQGTLQVASMTGDLRLVDSLQSETRVHSWDICEANESSAYVADESGSLVKIGTEGLWPT